MQVDAVLQQIRPFVQLFGTVLITVGVFKLFGFNAGFVPGEAWQICVIGLSLKSW
jgi:hypothetical protein